MNRTKRLKGPCEHCGAFFEYAAELVGTTGRCPHCGKVTELTLAAPPEPSGIPARVFIYTIIAALILLGGLGGSLYALKKMKALLRQRDVPAQGAPTNSVSR
jgi:hypothetical protein